MTVTAVEIEQYAGKKVIVTLFSLPEGEESVELEGKAEAANALGILLKPKGKTNFELIELSNIASVSLAPEKDIVLKARTLKLVELGQAKAHLLERHAYTLSEVNGLGEEQASDLHHQIDHPVEDLGHVHGAKASGDSAASIEEKAAVA